METKYEYFVQKQDTLIKEGASDVMNSMGELGWELCGVLHRRPDTNRADFIYKRALPVSKMGTVEPVWFIGDGDSRISFARGMVVKYKDSGVPSQEIIEYLSHLLCLEEILEETFWEVVDQLQWDKNSDYRQHGETLSKQFNRDQIMSLHYYAKMFRKQIQAYLNSYVVNKNTRRSIFCKGGDDSWWDFCAHVVGCGKVFFENVKRSPESVIGMKYKENFEYCFHQQMSERYNQQSNSKKKPVKKDE